MSDVAPTLKTVEGEDRKPASELLPLVYEELRRLAAHKLVNEAYADQNDSRDNGGSSVGDSGGPLFWVDPVTGQETLVAIVSRGTATSAHNYRVDTEQALSFIKSVIEKVENGTL